MEMSLDDAFRGTYAKAGGALLRLLTDVIRKSGKQSDDLAADLEVDPGQLSQALHDAGKHFSVKWLPRILHADRDNRILSFLAGLVDCEVVPRPRFTAEQLVERFDRECRQSGVAGEAIRARVHGEDS